MGSDSERSEKRTGTVAVRCSQEMAARLSALSWHSGKTMAELLDAYIRKGVNADYDRLPPVSKSRHPKPWTKRKKKQTTPAA